MTRKSSYYARFQRVEEGVISTLMPVVNGPCRSKPKSIDKQLQHKFIYVYLQRVVFTGGQPLFWIEHVSVR